MKSLTVYQIDAFTRERFRGNPAGVVIDADGLADHQMQLIARELNNSETAFLLSPPDDDCDGQIRYFTPTTEVPACGHATIAAMYSKALEYNLDSCALRYRTKAGVMVFEIIRDNGDYYVIMTQGKFELSPVLDPIRSQEVITALGLESSDLDIRCPVQIASTGHSKLMVGVRSMRMLYDLTPKFNHLADLSRLIKCNGYFVFTLDTDDTEILAHGRMFAPAIGINEDPVTGNAFGPLGGYLIQNKIVKYSDNQFVFKGRQGDAVNRPGVVNVMVHIEKGATRAVQIKGEAVPVFRTELVI